MEFDSGLGERVRLRALGHHPQAQVAAPRTGGTKLADKVKEVFFGFVKGANMRCMTDRRQHRVIRGFRGSRL